MSVWRPKTIFNPTKWANPGLGLSKRGKKNMLIFWGSKTSVASADKTSVVSARHLLCLQPRHLLCQQTRHLWSPKTSQFHCQHGRAAAVFAIPLRCLGGTQMSCLLPQQVSWLQTQQMSCLQTQKSRQNRCLVCTHNR